MAAYAKCTKENGKGGIINNTDNTNTKAAAATPSEITAGRERLHRDMKAGDCQGLSTRDIIQVFRQAFA